MDLLAPHQQNGTTFNSHHTAHPHTALALHHKNFSAHHYAMDLTHLHQQNCANLTPALTSLRATASL